MGLTMRDNSSLGMGCCEKNPAIPHIGHQNNTSLKSRRRITSPVLQASLLTESIKLGFQLGSLLLRDQLINSLQLIADEQHIVDGEIFLAGSARLHRIHLQIAGTDAKDEVTEEIIGRTW